MTQFVEQLRNQAKWYTQPGHNARDLLDSRLLEKAADEIECLRAKIAEMERQKPVGEIVAFGESLHEVSWKRGKLPHLGTKLYALPGAKGEEK